MESSRVTPRSTIFTGGIFRPSLNASRAWGLIEPGVEPPISVQWPLLATNATSSSSPKTGFDQLDVVEVVAGLVR